MTATGKDPNLLLCKDENKVFNTVSRTDSSPAPLLNKSSEEFRFFLKKNLLDIQVFCYCMWNSTNVLEAHVSDNMGLLPQQNPLHKLCIKNAVERNDLCSVTAHSYRDFNIGWSKYPE